MWLPALLKHPVGRTAVAGRWYLAAASMSALLLLTLHFAVQADVQQQARDVVSRWAQQQGVSVADVHYRMMRGALTLESFRFHIKDVELSAESLTLQGDITSFMNKEPRLSLLELRDIRLVTAGVTRNFWVSDGSYSPLLSRLWRSAKAIVIEDGKIAIGAGDFPYQAQIFELLRFRAVGAAGARQISGDFRLAGGWLAVNAEESWSDSRLPVMDARLEYGDLSAGHFLPGVLGWQEVKGELAGQLRWRATATKTESTASFTLTDDESEASQASVRWQGAQEQGAWYGEVSAQQWPLRTVAKYLPEPGDRKLQAGVLTGVIQLAGGDKGWIANSDQLEISGLHLQSKSADSAYAWRAVTAQARHLNLNSVERQLKIARLDLSDVAGGFDLATPASDGLGDWQLRVDEINLQHFHASAHVAGDRWLHLPALQGRSTWKKGGWQVALYDDQVEGWLLTGKASLKNDQISSLKLELDKAPLVRLRPLLPPLFRSSDAELEGSVTAELQLTNSRQGWRVAGEAKAENVRFGVYGDNWFANLIELRLINMGGEADHPRIGQVGIDGWRYHAPLVPLSLPGQLLLPMAQIDVRDCFGSWRIEKLLMSDGQLAVGQSSSVWLNHISAELSGISPDSTSELLLRGSFDEGSLYVKGDIGFSARRPVVKSLKVSIRDALPFFAREWLEHSGIAPLQRGRLYADLTVGEQDGGWQGAGYLRLQHGELEQMAVPVDQLLNYTGYNGYELFARLSDNDRIRLKLEIEGRGALFPVLGRSFVTALRQHAEERAGTVGVLVNRQTLSQLRLHEHQGFSHNERVRLRSVIARLQQNQAVELVPQLGERELSDETIRQIRYTQKLTADFMEERGIKRGRIFPVWPGPQHRGATGNSGLLLQVVSPGG